jgi:hypothetical protein
MQIAQGGGRNTGGREIGRRLEQQYEDGEGKSLQIGGVKRSSRLWEPVAAQCFSSLRSDRVG